MRRKSMSTYLKGTVFCGSAARGCWCATPRAVRHDHPYFVRQPSHGGRGDCTRQAMLIEQVERLYRTLLTPRCRSTPKRRGGLGDDPCQVDEMMAEGAAELADLASRRTQLEGEQKLLQAHYAEPSRSTCSRGSRTGSRVVGDHRALITTHHGHYADARANLDDSLKLLSNAADIYEHADDANRGLCNPPCSRRSTSTRTTTCVGYRNPYDGLSPDLHADATELGRRGRKWARQELRPRAAPGRKFTPDPFGVSDGLEPATPDHNQVLYRLSYTHQKGPANGTDLPSGSATSAG